ncbi:MAG: hypothetical protein N4A46_15400 [Schleiferiaceae bacterium]|jgi:hypothetical protein|nr:hypothetical protein [Schleiferiaceae bacterium]
MRLLFFLSILLYSFSAHAQLKLKYDVEAFVDMQKFEVHGNVKIDLINEGQTALTEIPIEIWPNAYQKKGTFLSEERLEDQKTDLYFANGFDQGKVDSLNLNAEIFYTKKMGTSINFEEVNKGELYILKLDEPLLTGNQVIIRTNFKIDLPSSSYNGFGVDPNSIRLSRWFPRVSGYIDSSFYPVFNNRDRYSCLNKADFNIKLGIDKNTKMVTSAASIEKIDAGNLTLHVFQVKQQTDFTAVLFPGIYEFDVPSNYTNGKDVSLYYDGDFPPIQLNTAFNQMMQFVKGELAVEAPDSFKILVLKDKKAFESAGNLVVIEKRNSSDNLEADIIEEWVKLIFTEYQPINGAAHPWLVHGLAHFYKTLYLRTYYPDKLFVGPIGRSFIGKFFDADEYPAEYRNIFLYQYVARQALDQPLSDSAAAFPRFNYQAIVKGKTALNFEYLRQYCGEREFKRSMHRFVQLNQQGHSFSSPSDLITSFKYYVFKDLDWFLNDLYLSKKPYNYRLVKTENCNTVYTATIRNRGKVIAPYSITGFKDGKQMLTQWFPGHEGKKTVQIHLEDYDKVVLNNTNRFPEFNQRDNQLKTSGLLKRRKPVKLQFYTSLENPNKTQIFWTPSLKYNAYDLFLIGASFYNSTIVQRPFTYKLTPEFSTGTSKLVGSGSLKYNWTFDDSFVHQITAGFYGRYYHYAEDLAFTRLSPALNFYLRKPNPRSNLIRQIKLRAVIMDKELPSDFDGNKFDLDFASYQVLNLKYVQENGHVLRPNRLVVSGEISELFSKLQFDFIQRFRVSANHTFALRVFAGTFLHNQNPDNDNFYSFGLSGTRDYMFDYYFIGRSDETGIWSQQMFETDGGFKSQTNEFSNESMLAINAKVPIYRYLKAFADIGWTNGTFAWDYGASIIIVPDFVEVHFPIQSYQRDFYKEANYWENVRFVLNLDPTEIINRLRRGYY